MTPAFPRSIPTLAWQRLAAVPLLLVLSLLSGCFDSPSPGEEERQDGEVEPIANATTVLWRNFTIQLTGSNAAGYWEHVGGSQGLSRNCPSFGNVMAAGLRSVAMKATFAGQVEYIEQWQLRYAIPDHGVEGEVAGALPLELEYNANVQPLPSSLKSNPTDLYFFVLPADEPTAAVMQELTLTARIEVENPEALIVYEQLGWCGA